MKRLLALDLSTKTGWAYFENDQLKEYGTIFLETKEYEYPFGWLERAKEVSYHVLELIEGKFLKVPSSGYYSWAEDLEVVIEETTAGKNNYSQKLLEWIHFSVLQRLYSEGCEHVNYVRTGVWRKLVGATQTKDERNHNARLARVKKKTGKKIAKLDGKRARKLDRKDYALRAFKDHFGVQLPYEMNDACDAALLGLAYIKGAPVCDGTTKGGI